MPEASDDIIQVAIVEDDQDIRKLLELLIDRSPGFSCKQVYHSCETAVGHLQESKPDVVLMDIGLPGMDGIEGIRLMKLDLPETDFIVLTIRDDDETVFQALAAGATGYLLKDTPPVKLLTSIREVRDGGAPMTPSIARKIALHFQPVGFTPLSSRETEILQYLCKGYSYTDVATNLFISGHTVRTHIKSIYEKLHVHSRASLVSKALRDRLI